MTTFNIDDLNVTVTDFIPREFKATGCQCKNKTTVMNAGRIEYTKCDDCGNEVWS